MSTQWDNRRHRRVGQLLQGRSTASLVERDRDLVEWCRDVVLNPVRAGMVRSARAYPWSSYRATAGLREPLALLCTAWMLAQCGAERAAAQRRSRRFVVEGVTRPAPWEALRGQIFLGQAGCVEEMRAIGPGGRTTMRRRAAAGG